MHKTKAYLIHKHWSVIQGIIYYAGEPVVGIRVLPQDTFEIWLNNGDREIVPGWFELVVDPKGDYDYV